MVDRLQVHRLAPTPYQVKAARKYGDESLGERPPAEFYAGAPVMPGFERCEEGCVISMRGCVMPHTDSWLGSYGDGPRKQRSLFWVVAGAVTLKVDGYPSVGLEPGHFVVFDHRREHMVLSNEKWLGAAWQLRPVSAASRGKAGL